MNKFIIYILLLFFIAIPLTSQALKESKTTPIKNIKLIISLSSFHNIKVADAQAVAQILANHIKKSHKLEYEFIVETPESISEIEKSANNDFDFIILTTEEYLNLYKKLSFEPFVTNYSAEHIGYKYHFIVNKSNEIDDISELKNETINVLSGKNQTAAFLWLDKLLKNKGLPNQKKYFKEVVIDYKATNVLLPVFFRKAKACVITNSSLNLLMELNPGIKDQIKIIYTSEPIILGITCLNPNKKNEDNYNILKEILISLHKNEYGKQLLHMFNTEKLILFKEEYLKGYYNLLE